MPRLAGQIKTNTCSEKHPYLSGNYAPIKQTRQLTPCSYTGYIPEELVGGQYVRNGGNPLSNENLGRDAHWFDGDGMLAGVLFERAEDGRAQPQFVAQFILTDLLLSSLSNRTSRFPILPSIATLVNPLSSLLTILLSILRAVILVVLSHLPGSRQAIKKISVCNTAIYYHDGRALATCESGPPMRVSLPELDTIGWFNGSSAEGELERKSDDIAFGGKGLLSFMKEWTTGHPKVDPETNEMILYHCTFAPPYIHYSVLPATKTTIEGMPPPSRLINLPVSGVSGGKMMHDFGVSRKHTIIMDLPLTLDPLNLAKNKPVVSYDPSAPSRFGVFSRRDPSNVHWFETSACCIFHTANAWDAEDKAGDVYSVNMLACRLTSATLVYSAGNVPPPRIERLPEESSKPRPFFDKHDFDDTDATVGKVLFPEYGGFDAAPALETLRQETDPLIQPLTEINPRPIPKVANDEPDHLLDEAEQCRLYYYSFILPSRTSPPQIAVQHALSAVPFEFPAVNPAYSMRFARYIYGCSTSSSSFGTALGKAAKVDVLVKLDVQTLIACGQDRPPSPVTGCVDRRSVSKVLAQQAKHDDPSDPVRCFRMPDGWYAQEARFVSRRGSHVEDDGYLLFYAFDETQLNEDGEAGTDALSELWVLDARSMRNVVAKIKLPQRVPYGLHGEWFDESQIKGQRPFDRARSVEAAIKDEGDWKGLWRAWMGAREKLEQWLA